MIRASNAISRHFPDQDRRWASVWRNDASTRGRSGSCFAKIVPISTSLRVSAHLDHLDTFVFLPCIWIACALGFAIGDYPMLFFLIPPLCIAYATIRRTMPPRLLSAYVALCILGGILSWFQLFPRSW